MTVPEKHFQEPLRAINGVLPSLMVLDKLKNSQRPSEGLSKDVFFYAYAGAHTKICILSRRIFSDLPKPGNDKTEKQNVQPNASNRIVQMQLYRYSSAVSYKRIQSLSTTFGVSGFALLLSVAIQTRHRTP